MVLRVRRRHGCRRRSRGGCGNRGSVLVVSWEISAAWKSEPDLAFASEVELRFIANADGTTTVELEHRDFERMESVGGEKMRKGCGRRLAITARAVSKSC